MVQQKISDEIRNAKNVRGHFAEYLKKQFKDSISIEDFIAMNEVIQIGIFYHFITKLNIVISLQESYYNIYFSSKVLKEEAIYKDLKSMEILEIVIQEEVETNKNIAYIEVKKEYEGSLFKGLKEALINTINFLNTTQWLNYHQS